MASELSAPRTTPLLPGLSSVPLRRRLFGFGSIYGKTIRDSRLSFIIAAGLLGGLALAMGGLISQAFPTPAARHDLDLLVGSMPPEMINLFGNATLMGDKLGTLGGYMTWKYGAMFALGTALWSILALSGTLAGEAAGGSLDLVAAAPFGKRRIAVEKLLAHLTVVWLAMMTLALMTTISSNAFGDAALGDPVPLGGSIGFALWVGLIAMLFGGLAFALGPVLGRGGSAAMAGIVMMVLWFASGLEIGGPLVTISPFHWTVAHIPLVGLFDWAGLALVAVVAAVLLVLGIELFVRRDLGVTVGLSLPTLPGWVLGVRGPLTRAFGDQLPRALAWGLGMAFWGAMLASLVGSFADRIGTDSSILAVFGQIFPGYDFSTAGAWLQLYVELLFIVAGFAGATFVARWASDETAGRLELVFSAPLARARWVASAGFGALAAVVVATVMLAFGIGVGAAAGGGTVGDAVLGTAALGLYAAAIVGIGFAIGGLWRASLAAEIAALVVVATFLLDILAPALGLPDWLHQLALTAHFGQPMVGDWDPIGVVACTAIAAGGIALGSWGLSRRDIGR